MRSKKSHSRWFDVSLHCFVKGESKKISHKNELFHLKAHRIKCNKWFIHIWIDYYCWMIIKKYMEDFLSWPETTSFWMGALRFWPILASARVHICICNSFKTFFSLLLFSLSYLWFAVKNCNPVCQESSNRFLRHMAPSHQLSRLTIREDRKTQLDNRQTC